MKKGLAVVMAAMLTLTMGMTVFAAESNSATATKEVSSVVNTDGTTTKTVTSALGTTVAVTASTTKTATSVGGVAVATSATVATGNNAVLAFTDASGKTVSNVVLAVKPASNETIAAVTSSVKVAGKEVAVEAKNIVAAIDINAAGFTSGSATVPLKVDNVKKGEAVYGIHIKNGIAEIIPAVALENGIVAITTTSFSPIIIVKGTAPAAVQTTTDTNAGADSDKATSPKTADAFPMAAVMAVICLAGAAVCAKKSVFAK